MAKDERHFFIRFAAERVNSSLLYRHPGSRNRKDKSGTYKLIFGNCFFIVL